MITETTVVTCPHCGRVQYAGECSMGPAGDGVTHFKCRNCHGWWNTNAGKTLSCKNWDSLKPQNVFDANGNCVGVLQPRATADRLGFGIQGWSRPEFDTRLDVVTCECGQFVMRGEVSLPCPMKSRYY